MLRIGKNIFENTLRSCHGREGYNFLNTFIRFFNNNIRSNLQCLTPDEESVKCTLLTGSIKTVHQGLPVQPFSMFGYYLKLENLFLINMEWRVYSLSYLQKFDKSFVEHHMKEPVYM